MVSLLDPEYPRMYLNVLPLLDLECNYTFLVYLKKQIKNNNNHLYVQRLNDSIHAGTCLQVNKH